MNRHNVLAIKIISVILALMMIFTSVLTAGAAEQGSEKEEVAYVNLNSDGSVNEINVVNILTVSGGKAVDYGNYASVRNMTTTDDIDYSNGKVNISTNTDKLYYEGKLEDNTIPWDISIQYYIDGVKYSANEIAGKSGALKIKINIKQNKHCKNNFFKGYALQLTMSLDTDNCTNIKADGATIANVGSKKQLTYTILPNKGADLEVTADVINFEMDAVTINGIKLNLNVEVDDKELMEQVDNLIDAVGKLDDGAGKINDGASTLKSSVQNNLQNGVSSLADGASEMQSKAGDLKSGATAIDIGAKSLESGSETLDNGVRSLQNGVGQLKNGLKTLNSKSSDLTTGSAQIKSALITIQTSLENVSVSTDKLAGLTSASSQIKSGIADLVAGVQSLEQNAGWQSYKNLMLANGLDIDALKESNSQAAQNIQGMIETLNTQIAQLEAMGADTSSIQAQVQQLKSIAALLAANNANISGTESYLNTLNENIGSLLKGATALQTNYNEFDLQISTLADSITELAYNMTLLKSGIDTLVNNYVTLDGGVNDYTVGVAQIVSGYDEIANGTSTLASGSSELVLGTKSLNSGTGELLSGISQFYDAAGTLKNGTESLDAGVEDLLKGAAVLNDGTSSLKTGTSQLNSKTSGMNTEISNKINSLLDSITGRDSKTVSFVSKKNTKVDSVQFVLKTPAIEIPETAAQNVQKEEHLNFWQKLLRLFGWY